MAFIETGKIITTSKSETIEVCDVCDKPVEGVYPLFAMDVEKYAQVCYEDEGRMVFYGAICSPECVKTLADQWMQK